MAIRRRILSAGLILGFGALVNVAVAWGCAAWHYAGTAPRIASQDPRAPGGTWSVASYTSRGAKRIHSVWGPIGASDPEQPSPLELVGAWGERLAPDASDDPERGGARVVDMRGWPLRSMWSLAEFDLDVPRGGSGLRLGKCRARSGVELPAYAQWTSGEAELHKHRVLPLGIVWWAFAANTLLFGAVPACLAALVVGSRRAIRAGAGRCGRCGYRLVHASRAQCPECGRPFRPGWVGSGAARWVRRGAMACWAAVAVAAVVAAAGLAWSGIEATWWNRHKPVWWLALDGESADGDKAGAAVDELLRRFRAGDFNDEQAGALVTRALAIQSDRERPWVPQWGDLVVAARDAELVDDEQWDGFPAQMIEPELVARPRIARGDAIPSKVVVRTRAPSAGDFMLYSEHLETTLGDVSLRGAGTMRGQSAAVAMGSGTRQIEIPIDEWVHMTPAIDAGPGTHVMKSRWRFRVIAGAPPPPLSYRRLQAQLVTGGQPFELSAEIEVIRKTGSTVALVDDESLRRAMRSSMQVRIYRRPLTSELRGTLVFKDPPMDFAFEVLVPWRDTEWSLGTVTSEAGTIAQVGSYGTFRGSIDGLVVETVDVILSLPGRRPRSRSASRASGTAIWSSRTSPSRRTRRDDPKPRRRAADSRECAPVRPAASNAAEPRKKRVSAGGRTERKERCKLRASSSRASSPASSAAA